METNLKEYVQDTNESARLFFKEEEITLIEKMHLYQRIEKLEDDITTLKRVNKFFKKALSIFI